MAEVIFAGFGGQGIIRSGIIVGRAAAIYDNKFATMNQDFGPEARGGATSVQLVISESRVLYPYLTALDVLVAMSQEAYQKFEPKLPAEKGLLLIDEDLVKLKPVRGKIRVLSVPATRFAEEMGNRVIANVVMLGSFNAVTNVVSKSSMEKAVAESVPPRFIDLNLKAFEKGYQYGLSLI